MTIDRGPPRVLASAVCCVAKSGYLDIGVAMQRCMDNRMNNREVKSIKMFYVSPEALSRLLRADYLRAEMFSGLMQRFTWGKR
ncbi:MULTISPECIES: hypothetical protein [unclassified Burkholderia]|uniref:hypothetical protein n=1 Tax=unclassified Burkholderia TaxID=2613784 RepID=UPI002AB08877|nr:MULTISPECIES: hypothetical protein [unclassified Burkholderia]